VEPHFGVGSNQGKFLLLFLSVGRSLDFAAAWVCQPSTDPTSLALMKEKCTKGVSDLSARLPSELVGNLQAFRTAAAVAEFSVYRLFPEEEYLFNKYYKAGERVLDLACGMGRTTLLLHEMGLSVRGIDRSEVFIHLAQKRLPHLDLKVGSYDYIEEPDSSFSHVLISFNGIDYAFPESQRITALGECSRVLKPGGTFIYSSHNLKSLHWFSPYHRHRLPWKLRHSLRAYREWAYVFEEVDGLHTFHASADFVIRQTESFGLRLLEMRWDTFRKLDIDRFHRYFSPYIHYAFRKPARPGS
jgi:SAM-dependent methyltransferase